jgi:predicted nucleotidyltransferase
MKSERRERASKIITLLKEIVPGVIVNHPVTLAYLHGSVARGAPLPTSDIDIAVLLTERELSGYEELQGAMAIEADLERRSALSGFDVHVLNHAPILVQGPIVQEGILLYESDKAARVAFEVLTRKKYFDYLPLARRTRKAILKNIRERGLTYGA